MIMMKSLRVLLFSCAVSLIILCLSSTLDAAPSSSSSSSSSSPSSGRLALRHSFKAPFTNKQLPFWSVGAGAIVNDTYVRLTPARQSRTGYIWNTVPCSMIDWEVVIEYQVTGHPNYGGDGFAFWYVEKSETLGNVYGSMDYWVGLAVTFDTFNNDGIGKSPLISAIYNDGTQRFDSFSDGASQAAASCSFDFRNSEEPVHAKITYQGQKLTVQIAIHKDGSPVYHPCFEVEKIDLGVDKYFGLSAHTGDVADNHDIYSVLTRDLSAENADIEAVRKRFRASLSAEQSKHSKGEMNQNDFHHHIVTTLAQMQEELNLLELGQIAINDWLNTKTPQSAAQLAGETAVNAPALSSSPVVQPMYSVKFDQSTMQKISTLIENQQNILKEIKVLQTMINSNTPSSSSSSSNAGLMQSFITHTSNTDGQFRQVREQLNAFQRRVDDILQNVLRTRTQTESAQLAGASDGDEVGWSVYFMIIFIATGVGSVAFYNFRQHSQKERYKMI